jgi:hypothetical protein
MKRLFVTAVLLVTALAFSVTTGVAASASKVTVAHYNVRYTDQVVGPVDCIGIHKSGGKYGGTAGIPGTGGQDSFTCTSTTGSPLTGVTPNEAYPLAVNTWASDYNGALNTIATTLTVSADGFSYSGVVSYF